jgi:uncharacterized coiled-coil DUF342 family protein
MIIKNQYLLAALVVLGVLQLWSLGCLERASSRVESRLEEKHVKDTTVLAKEAVELKRQLHDARGQIEQIHSELRNTQNLLNQTRAELEKVKAAATKDAAAGGEERKQ